jgi:hypothetical protein
MFTRPGINQKKKNNNSARLGSMISEMSRPNSWRSGNRRSSAKVKKTNWLYQWIGLRENLQESPIFHGKIYGFL